MGQRLSIGTEALNIRELSKFRAYWSRSEDYPPENFGNNVVHVPVAVHYSWANGRAERTFTSTFRAFIGSGPSDGNVDIDDVNDVEIEEFHLAFKPGYQKYKFSERDHSLTISASSPKMGGRYTVKITPTIGGPEADED